MYSRTLIIGTRGSQLALAQTRFVVEALHKIAPKAAITVKVISTKGDVNDAPIPMTTVGKTWFTAEIEQALMSGTIDIAVHSLKDVAPENHAELCTLPVLDREDPYDVLVSQHQQTIAELPKHAVVGTDSIRRKAALLQLRPDLYVKSIRGNINTRLAKLATAEYDAIVIAAAGLVRLGLQDRISQKFTADECTPAIGQGVIAVQFKKDNKQLASLVEAISNDTLQQTVAIEQAFSQIADGGCKRPVGCLAKVIKDQVTIVGMVGSEDAQHTASREVTGNVDQAIQLAETLASQLKTTLANHRSDAKYVVLTRDQAGNRQWRPLFEAVGLKVYELPCIAIEPLNSDADEVAVIKAIKMHDWVVFTSANGVRAFAALAAKHNFAVTSLPKVAVIGASTAKALEKIGADVAYIPEHTSSKGLAAGFPAEAGAKVLLLRTSIALEDLPTDLRARGFIVDERAVYTTKLITTPDPTYARLVADGQVGCVVCASPSAVQGFMARTASLKNAKSAPMYVMGESVVKTLRANGYQDIVDPNSPSLEGLLQDIRQRLL